MRNIDIHGKSRYAIHVYFKNIFCFEKGVSMFFSNSLRRVFTRSVLSLFVVFTVLFVSCKQEPDDGDPSLNGTWKSTYDEVFIINLNNNTFSCPSEDYPGYAYGGTISEVVYLNNSNTAGIIFIELTDKGSDFSTSGSGDFTGVYFTNLTDKTVEICIAANPAEYATPVRTTLAEAKELLNVDSVSTYFAMTSACEKQ